MPCEDSSGAKHGWTSSELSPTQEEHIPWDFGKSLLSNSSNNLKYVIMSLFYQQWGYNH